MTITDAWKTAIDKTFDAFLHLAIPGRLSEFRDKILQSMHNEIDLHNTVCPKDARWRKPISLTVYGVTEILSRLRIVRAIDLYAGPCADRTTKNNAANLQDREPLLAVYDPKTGLYSVDHFSLLRIALELEPDLSLQSQETILRNLKTLALRVQRTFDPDLIPVNNGIFNYKTKELLPFSPDFVFLTKSPVDYIPFPSNPVIHNDEDGTDWDIESWMKSLSDDPDIVRLLWQVAGACVRPGVPWDKVALLYATRGGNGKGTYCEFLRSLAGYTASIPIDKFDSVFGLEELISSSAVIADENNVAGFLDNLANFKAVITGDVIQINRKYKVPVSFRFRGFMVQCVNKILKVRDKTGSLARRLMYIPFDKCFVNGDLPERKYIKHDYLHRKEVLEYALHKILHMDYYEFDIPHACDAVLHEHELSNSPVLDFAEEMLPRLRWNLAPFTFLYDLYKAWFRENCPSGTLQSSRSFVNDLLDILASKDLGWECPDKTRQISPSGRMSGPEPLIAEYDLTAWTNPAYKGTDPDKISMPVLKYLYRGITKKPVPGTPGPDDSPDKGPNDGAPSPDKNHDGDTNALSADNNTGAETCAEPSSARPRDLPQAPETGAAGSSAKTPPAVPPAPQTISAGFRNGPRTDPAPAPAQNRKPAPKIEPTVHPGSETSAKIPANGPQPDAVAPTGPFSPSPSSVPFKSQDASQTLLNGAQDIPPDSVPFF